MATTLESTFASHPELVNALFPVWNAYIPQVPTAKQTAFLMLPHLEAFFGGAGGGGKTSVLCMGALQYCHIPNYSAVIFRKTHKDHLEPKSPGARIIEWIGEQTEKGLINGPRTKLGVRFDGQQMQFTFFPSYSTLMLGYIGEAGQKYRYQGTEFQYIGWDEVAQHWEDDYTFMFSRLRKNSCPIHKVYNECADGSHESIYELLGVPGICSCCRQPWILGEDNGQHKGDPIYVDGCKFCDQAKAIPLRIRATSNPPGMGERGAVGDWVKNRFDIRPDPKTGMFRGMHPTRFYMPSYVTDNPHVSQNEYMAALQHMDPISRDQMIKGDWNVQSSGRFRREWARYYTYRPNPASEEDQAKYFPPTGWRTRLDQQPIGKPFYGDIHPNDFFIMGEARLGNAVGRSWLRSQCHCFSTVDPAASLRDGPNDAQIWEGKKEPSYTVIATWLLTPDFNLLWVDMVRFQRELPFIIPACVEVFQRLRPDYFVIEANGINTGVVQYAIKEGLNVKPYFPMGKGDPFQRAWSAANRMEHGQIWLPSHDPPWLAPAVQEVFTWTGMKGQRDDIVSALSMAAHTVDDMASSHEQKPKQGGSGTPPLPRAHGGLDMGSPLSY